ncbi:MAG: ATP-dependent DNA helicase RecQ, partial [bacterium]|nr:ATP-dependent DNA helicase RecQ [bacterium]
YHGQMGAGTRKRHQDRWMNEQTRVLVGTVAFGLGIDKPDVRAVIHLSLPKSIEQYYQEAGRAGRDGLPSDCALLWQKRDAGLLAHFIQQIENPEESSRAWRRYRTLRRFAESAVCRHLQVCEHFGQSTRWRQCGSCDVCGPEPQWFASPDQAPKPVLVEKAAAGDTDEALLDHLTRWRRETARQQGVPAYVVLNNAGLHDLCLQRPQSHAELLRVNGIGPKRAERYGDNLLNAIKRYAS